VVFSNSDKKLYSYDGSAWAAVGGSASSGVTMISAESASTYTHAGACAYCYNLSATAAYAMNGDTTTTYTDWRMPTIGEAAVFEGTVTSTNYVWTGSTAASYWLQQRFSDGNFNTDSYSVNIYYARCVR